MASQSLLQIWKDTLIRLAYHYFERALTCFLATSVLIAYRHPGEVLRTKDFKSYQLSGLAEDIPTG
jgi:hypothetical protein